MDGKSSKNRELNLNKVRLTRMSSPKKGSSNPLDQIYSVYFNAAQPVAIPESSDIIRGSSSMDTDSQVTDAASSISSTFSTDSSDGSSFSASLDLFPAFPPSRSQTSDAKMKESTFSTLDNEATTIVDSTPIEELSMIDFTRAREFERYFDTAFPTARKLKEGEVLDYSKKVNGIKF